MDLHSWSVQIWQWTEESERKEHVVPTPQMWDEGRNITTLHHVKFSDVPVLSEIFLKTQWSWSSSLGTPLGTSECVLALSPHVLVQGWKGLHCVATEFFLEKRFVYLLYIHNVVLSKREIYWVPTCSYLFYKLFSDHLSKCSNLKCRRLKRGLKREKLNFHNRTYHCLHRVSSSSYCMVVWYRYDKVMEITKQIQYIL